MPDDDFTPPGSPNPSAHLERIEKLRAKIPAEVLMHLLCRAALTGEVVKFDDRGNILPDEPDVIGGKDRLAYAKSMFETAVPKTPAAPQNLPPPKPTLDDVLYKGVENLTNKELDFLISELEHDKV